MTRSTNTFAAIAAVFLTLASIAPLFVLPASASADAIVGMV